MKYGALGLALPELVASPAGQMGAARLLYKTGPRLLPAVTGGGLGLFDRGQVTAPNRSGLFNRGQITAAP